MGRYSQSLVAGVAVVAMLLLCARLYSWIARNVHASFIHAREARFDALPTDDKALKAWLQAQPGVVSHTVHVGRDGADKKLVAVIFVQVRNMAGEPPVPDLDAACARLGYTGPDEPFRPSDQSRVVHEP